MSNKQFEFLNNSFSISSDIKLILGFIEDNIVNKASSVLFKAKVIITELLTNSLKHSGISNTYIDVSITDVHLIIIKTDLGTPLSLISKDYSINKNIPITNDILHTLYAVLNTQYDVSFFCDENNMDDVLAVEDIVEHFGLLIITKAADKFTYRYDEHTKENIFKVTLDL
jgi:anti-sigma regulatory factor (Ser/Thr protein kinase)